MILRLALLALMSWMTACGSDEAPFLVNIETSGIALAQVDSLVLQLAPASVGQSFSEEGTGSFYDGNVRTRVAPGGELVITIDRAGLVQWVTRDSQTDFTASIPLRPGGGGGGQPTLRALLFAQSSELGRGAHPLPWPLESGASIRVRIVAP